MNYQNIIAAIGLLGIGAILKSIIDAFFEKRKMTDKTGHEFKQVRYKAIILLMYSFFDFEKHKKELLKNGRDFKNTEELLDEIKAEWSNMTLFASDNVIRATKKFIQTPNSLNYNTVALEMRKDLYGLKTKLTSIDLELK
jgi:hypothetical protein